MKKLTAIILSLFIIFSLFACKKEQAKQIPLSELPEAYSLEDAKGDGMVIHVNGDIAYGQKLWDSFLEETEKGNAAKIRLGEYYTLRDKSKYAPDYYEEIKDDYPKLYIFDLSFDGKSFTVTHFEDGKEFSEAYKYLRKFEGEAESPTATYSSYVRYVLTNDSTVTLERLHYGLYSSQFGDYIPFFEVYSDLVMKE